MVFLHRKSRPRMERLVIFRKASVDRLDVRQYLTIMIKSIKHKALRSYWTKGQSKGLNAEWLPRIRIIMDALDAANAPEDMNFPGSRFHALKGDLVGYYSVRLTGNYRIIFQSEEDGFTLVDITDYH